MKLTGGERKQILAGDYSALKRDDDPGDCAGVEIPIIRDRPRRAPIYSDALFSGHHRRVVDYQEVPEHWSLWIKLEAPKRHRKGHWQIAFTVHDERQNDRILRAGGPPGPPREAGLRTRQTTSPDNPRPKGEGVGSFTDETARGYGGGGRQALDHGGVDDAELARQRTQADERWMHHKETESQDELDRQQMRAMREQLKQAMRECDAPQRAYLLAGIARLLDEARQ